MKINKMMPFNGYFDVGCYLDGLVSGGDVVVLFPSRKEIVGFKNYYSLKSGTTL